MLEYRVTFRVVGKRTLSVVCGRQLRKDRSHPVCAISSDKTNAAPLDLQSWILVAPLVSHASECWTIRTAFALPRREDDGAEVVNGVADRVRTELLRNLGLADLLKIAPPGQQRRAHRFAASVGRDGRE